MDMVKSVLLFIIAGFFEIGEGYLIWLYLREGRGVEFAILGAIILVLYGIVPTLQPAKFWKGVRRLWWYFHSPFTSRGWGIDKVNPDHFDN
jgi:small multidrug resistance family-3 protein